MKTMKYIPILIMNVMFFFTTQLFATKHIVHVGSFYFNPASLNVNVGDTMRWVWDGGSHTTTSTTIPSGAASWDSPITSSITSFEYKVTVSGTYNYVCTPHAGMGQVASFTAAGSSPTLSVSPSGRNVPASAGTTTFNVTSNSSWTATSNVSWCIVTSSGSGNGTLFADYLENTSLTPRTAIITVTVNGLPSQNVTVNQAGAVPVLVVSPLNQQVGSTSGTTTFSVQSNTAWTTSSNASWCTVTPSGNGNGTINAVYQQNFSNQVRIASITVTVAGLPDQIVTVTQDRSTVGIAGNTNDNLNIFPNPSSGIFNISMKQISDDSKNYFVLNSQGQTVQQGNIDTDHFVLDLTGNKNGIYFLQINEGNTKTVYKIHLNSSAERLF